MSANSFENNRDDYASYSRTRILDAAVRCLVELGYSASSTVEIQKMAGFSRGRLLYYFPSKDSLLIAAAQHLAAGRVQETGLAAAAEMTAEPGSPTRVDQAIEVMWQTYQQPYFWASVELWIAARHNADIGVALRPAERTLYATIADVVDDLFGVEFTAHPSYRLIRELLLTSMRGVAMTYSFNPRDPSADHHLQVWKHAAHTLLDT